MNSGGGLDDSGRFAAVVFLAFVVGTVAAGIVMVLILLAVR